MILRIIMSMSSCILVIMSKVKPSITPLCNCHDEAIIKTSWTETNSGRKFYGCKHYEQNGCCRYFQWLDPEVDHRYQCLLNGLLRRIKQLDSDAEDEIKRLQALSRTKAEDFKLL